METPKINWETLPKWVKALIMIILGICAGISAVISFSSCGPMTRVTTRTSDSAAVNISINAPSTNEVTNDIDVQPSVTVEKTGKNTYTYTLNNK